jgi:hypothetical protein
MNDSEFSAASVSLPPKNGVMPSQRVPTPRQHFDFTCARIVECDWDAPQPMGTESAQRQPEFLDRAATE